jgi:hypothetical protein
MTWCTVIFYYSLEGAKKNHENCSQHSWDLSLAEKLTVICKTNRQEYVCW